MKNKSFNPNWASPPWDSFESILVSKNLKDISNSELAALLKLDDPLLVFEFKNGLTVIDEDFAKKLANFTNSNYKFWLNREKQYKEKLQEIFYPFEDWSDGFMSFLGYVENPDSEDCIEWHLEKHPNGFWELQCAENEVGGPIVYFGKIPDRDFFIDLIKNIYCPPNIDFD